MDILVEPRGNATVILQSPEGSLDDIPVSVQCLIVGVLKFSIGSWRDDRLGPSCCEPLAQGSAVIAFVGDHIFRGWHSFQAGMRSLVITCVSWCEQQNTGAALAICHRMDFRCPTTFAETNSMAPGPPFAPPEHRSALTIVLSIINVSGAPSAPARVENISSQMPRSAHLTKRL